MKHHLRVLLIIISLISIKATSQDYSSTWEAYFSYLDIVDFANSNEGIYAASENAILDMIPQPHNFRSYPQYMDYQAKIFRPFIIVQHIIYS